jgi:hypothetical protein
VIFYCLTIIVAAFTTAFCYVEFVNTVLISAFEGLDKSFLNRKPFNCVKCMSGWLALIGGVIFFGWYGLLFLPAGVFVGAMFEAIKMRYL